MFKATNVLSTKKIGRVGASQRHKGRTHRTKAQGRGEMTTQRNVGTYRCSFLGYKMILSEKRTL